MRWNVDCSTNVHVYGGIGDFRRKADDSERNVLAVSVDCFRRIFDRSGKNKEKKRKIN